MDIHGSGADTHSFSDHSQCAPQNQGSPQSEISDPSSDDQNLLDTLHRAPPVQGGACDTQSDPCSSQEHVQDAPFVLAKSQLLNLWKDDCGQDPPRT